MDEIVRMPRKELERQQERARKLALEKSYLQLTNDLMNSLSMISGLENTVEAVPRLILEHIGCANISVYYLVYSEIHSFDVYGHRRTMTEADDEMVKQAFESGQFIEEEREFKDTKMLTLEFTKASYWALPLKAGERLIGVLKMDGMLMVAAEMRGHLQPFFTYVALVLKNEIENYSKLKEAYAQLQKINNDLSGAQDALRNAYAEMEARVIEKTMGLQNANQLLTAELAERKRAEEDLRRLNRELRAISNCNQALIRATDEDTLLHDVCRIVCEEAGYCMAWVGYAEHDEAKTIRPMAWAGSESGYIEKAKLSWNESLECGRGPAGMAVRTGEVVYVQDFTTDPRMAPWRDPVLPRGYRSGMAFPLKGEEGEVFGVMLLYSDEANSITPDEIKLMEELVGDLAFGHYGSSRPR